MIAKQNVSCIKCVLFECVGRGTQSRFLQDSEAVHRQGKPFDALIPQCHRTDDTVEGLHIHPGGSWKDCSFTCSVFSDLEVLVVCSIDH